MDFFKPEVLESSVCMRFCHRCMVALSKHISPTHGNKLALGVLFIFLPLCALSLAVISARLLLVATTLGSQVIHVVAAATIMLVCIPSAILLFIVGVCALGGPRR